ncbi:hypothetical protein [Nocardia niwae]|uniref:Secreted protein n=1 Tax=Nocardia niwae TaxID=626084 RepID=A0ABV2X363_9NOCA
MDRSIGFSLAMVGLISMTGPPLSLVNTTTLSVLKFDSDRTIAVALAGIWSTRSKASVNEVNWCRLSSPTARVRSPREKMSALSRISVGMVTTCRP